MVTTAAEHAEKTEGEVKFNELEMRAARKGSIVGSIPGLYWRLNNGQIAFGPGTETEQAVSWLRKGHQPLTEYGGLFYRIEHQAAYRQLLLSGGGKEFAIEQIVENRWHFKPPYGLTTDAFPQLAEYDIPEPVICDECADDREYSFIKDLRKHAMIAHRYRRDDVEGMLKRQGRSLNELNKIRLRKDIVKSVAVAEDAPAPPEKAVPYCDACEKTFANAGALKGHMRFKHGAT